MLGALEELSVDRARIARLEELLRNAAVVDPEFDGCATLGCAAGDAAAA